MSHINEEKCGSMEGTQCPVIGDEIVQPLPLAGKDELMVRLEPIPGWRLAIIFTCVGMGLLLSIMDTTIVATMLYQLSKEFGDFALLPWVIVSYTLAYVGLAAFVSRVADVFGRKTMILVCFVLFFAASLACGFSHTMSTLIGFRAMQGVGGAGLYSLAMIIFPELSPPIIVPIISVIVGAIVAIGGVCGPIVGGLFTTYKTWRWAFWLNGPCSGAAAVVLFFAWPRNLQTFTSLHLTDLDWVGTILTMGSSVLLVFIINQAAIRQYAWNSAPTITVIVLSGLCWIALIVWERYIHFHPKFKHIRAQFPYRIMSNRVMLGSLCCTFCTGFVMMLAVANVPFRAEIVNVYSAVKSGVLLLPLMAGLAVGCAIGGAAQARRNNTFYTLVAAAVLMLVGSVLLSTLRDTLKPQTKQWAYEAVLGLGLGINLATTTFITSLHVEFEDHAVAQGIVAQMRVFGGSLGVAASFIVLNKNIQDKLTGVLTPDQLDAFYQSPVATYNFSLPQQLMVRNVYVDSFNSSMHVCAGFAAVSIVASICTLQRHPPTVEKRLKDLQDLYARSTAPAALELDG